MSRSVKVRRLPLCDFCFGEDLCAARYDGKTKQFKNMDCDKLMRDGFCVLDPGHRGRHSTVGFFCDSCSRMRRGTPAGQATDANGDVDVVFCWFCLNVEHPRRIV